MERIRSKYTSPDYRFVRFSLGGLEFGIELKDVKEILRHREPALRPGAPSFIEGFIEAKGLSIPVIDLRKRFSLPAVLTRDTRLLITALNSHVAALVVDAVKDITMGGKELRIRHRSMSGKAWERCVDALVETSRGSVMMIDPLLILTHDELESLDTPMPQETVCL